MMQDPYQEGFEAGLKGWRIENDWAGYPTLYATGWDAGIIIWRRTSSYWGA